MYKCIRPTSWELKETLEAEPLDANVIHEFGDMIRMRQLDSAEAVYTEPCELIPSDEEEQETYEDLATHLLSPTQPSQFKPTSADIKITVMSKVKLWYSNHIHTHTCTWMYASMCAHTYTHTHIKYVAAWSVVWFHSNTLERRISIRSHRQLNFYDCQV